MVLALTHRGCGHVIAVTSTWRHHRRLTTLRRNLPAPRAWAIRPTRLTTAVDGLLAPACPDCAHDGRTRQETT